MLIERSLFISFTASAQVPSVVHAAADKLPRQFGGNGAETGDPAADDVAADGNLVYPADSSSANGVRYTPDTPDVP